MATKALPIPLGPIARTRNWDRYPDPKGKKDPSEGTLTDEFRDFFNSQSTDLQATPGLQTAPSGSTAQTGNVPLTDLAGPLAGGMYRFTYYTSTLTPAGATQSVVVNLAWTENGLTKGVSFPAMVGNTNITTSSGTYAMNIDSATPISWSTTYIETGAPGSYDVYVVLEALSR